MATHEHGDHVKMEFPDETTGIEERICVPAESCDEKKQLVFGRLDNEPLKEYAKNTKLVSQVAVSLRQPALKYLSLVSSTKMISEAAFEAVLRSQIRST